MYTVFSKKKTIMNLIQLQYFVMVADNNSYSVAAEKLYTSQSSVSKQILSLEKELHTHLFDRSHRKVSLTEQGSIVYTYACNILKDHQSMLSDLSRYDANPSGHITIGSIPVFSEYNLLDIIHSFSEVYPDIEIKLQEMEASDLLDALKDQTVDLAFFREEFMDSSMTILPLLHDTLCAVLPYSHPLAGEDKLDIAQLAGEDFLFLDKSTLHYDHTYDLCVRHGFTPNIVYTSTHIENILQMVGKGMGVALLMKTVASALNQGRVRLIPLSDTSDDTVSTVGLVRLKRRYANPVLLAFWNWVRDNYKI